MKENLIVVRGEGCARPSAHPLLLSKFDELGEAARPESYAEEHRPLLREALRLVGSWEGEGVVAGFDEETRTWMFIALHESTLGLAAGGCRMQVYAEHALALADAMRLAEAMTSKWAAAGLG